MRVPIPHNLPSEEVRRRLRDNVGDLPDHIPGGVAEVDSSWPSEDRMMLSVGAMGQHVNGYVDIEDTQLVFEVQLPPALSFFEPIVEKAVRSQGQKLLSKD